MAQENNKITYKQTLSFAGLTEDQADIYGLLIKNGPLPAGKIHQKTPFKRGLVYKILEQLIEQGIVIRIEEPGKVAIFEPAHPLKLQELAEQKEEEAKSAKSTLKGVMDQLVMDYNLTQGKPGVQFYEGISGFKKVHEEILLKAREVKIFASDVDAYNPKLRPLIQDQIKKQHRLGIKVKVIGNFLKQPISLKRIDELPGYEVDFRLLNNFRLPSQVFIFKDRVAISAINPELVTTIIQNQAIADTFSIVFDTLWQIATPAKEAHKDDFEKLTK